MLVAGLLLIGLVADRDGLFAAAGHRLARSARGGPALLIGATLMVGVVTALLNLDTSVAFLTPILVYAARSRGGGEAPLLYGCLLLSNAASLFLPGSNLTNLIVLGHFSVSGTAFLKQMWAPALAALSVTALVVAVIEHRALRLRLPRPAPWPARADGPVVGLGLMAIVVSTTCMLVLRSPALPVLIIGVVAVGQRIATGQERGRHALGLLGLPILIGLFGVAVALGTLGRVWAGPETLHSHLNLWGTAAVAAVCADAGEQPPRRVAVGGAPRSIPTRSSSDSTSDRTSSSPVRWPGCYGCARPARPTLAPRSPTPADSAPWPCRCPWPPRSWP